MYRRLAADDSCFARRHCASRISRRDGCEVSQHAGGGDRRRRAKDRRAENRSYRRLFPKSISHRTSHRSPVRRGFSSVLAPAYSTQRRRYCFGSNSCRGPSSPTKWHTARDGGRMNLLYGDIVEVFSQDGMRMGKIRVAGATKNIPLELLTDARPGDRVLLCDGVAISKVTSSTDSKVDNVPRDSR